MPRDTRPYITLHDGMPDHPKIEGLSDAAFRLLVTTWCWCNRSRTDGKVRAASWAKRGTPKARRELIEAGLAEVTDDGVQMHDYLEHQRSAAEIDELSRKRAEAGRKGGNARASAQANASASAKHRPEQAASKTEAEKNNQRLARDTSSKSGARERATRLPDDWKPSPELVEWQHSEGISDLLAKRELPRFRDYWASIGGDKGRKLDWDATWRNWLRREHDREVPAAQPVGRRPFWEN